MPIRALSRTILHRFITSIPQPVPLIPNPNPRFLSTVIPSQLLQQTHRGNLVFLPSLFQRYGFPASQLHDFLTKNQFILNWNPSEIEQSLNILLSLKPSQEFLVSTVLSCPRVLELEFIQKWGVGMSHSGVSCFTARAIQNVLEISRKFSFYPADFLRCLKFLKGLGFSDGTVTRILEIVPMVLLMSENRICDSIEFLLGIGFQRNELDRIANSFPGVLALGIKNKLENLVVELKGLGFGQDVVRREILRDPRVLGFEVGELSQCLRLLKTLKCRGATKDKIFCQGALRAAFEVKLRVDYLQGRGLIYREALGAVWREPRVILYSLEDIERKVGFLVNRMNLDVSLLVEVPEYLGVNFEKQIVPRYNVIEHLRSKGGLGDEVWLKPLIKLSRLKFYNLYVKPYPECEKMYGRFSRDVEVRNQHPVGLWKLFKPQKHGDSEEDIKNIKSFMDSLV